MVTPTQYERDAYVEIARWRAPQPSAFAPLLNRLTSPLGFLARAGLASPAGDVVGRALVAGLEVLNKGVLKTIRPEGVFAKFAKAGHPVRDGRALRALGLETVDTVVGRLELAYVTAAAVEGAGIGMEGALGLFADVPLILGLNLRAIADHAAHYGFDPDAPGERAYALGVLDLALAGTPEARAEALARLDKLAEALASRGDVERLGGADARQLLANSISQRMVKGKVAQVLPVAGAVVGGGFNAWFTHKTCDAARHLYRERFLDLRLAEADQPLRAI